MTYVFELYSNGKPTGEILHKTFNTEAEMLRWLRSQDGHPWLHLERIYNV